ncbi:MAG: hypothetical protein LC708_03465 [Actinobacteria bacterium]|nr:hypothetical protein [Actinomycetota bacterium]
MRSREVPRGARRRAGLGVAVGIVAAFLVVLGAGPATAETYRVYVTSGPRST